MSSWLEGVATDLVLQVEQWPPGLAYGLLALSAFLENVVPPVPGDLVVILSAYLAGRGALAWVPVYAATCAGGTAGFLVMYAIGRYQGRAFLRARGGRSLVFSPETLARAEAWLGRWGGWLVLANRFLTGIRSVIALAAGVGGMRWRHVALLGLASMLLWNGALLYAGWMVGQNWEAVTQMLGRYHKVLGSLLVIVVGALWWRRWRGRRRRAANGRRQRAPTGGPPC